MKISMRVESHLWTVRCVLLAVLVAPSLHCGDGGPPEACNCDCLDVPDDDDTADDDDSVDGGDDDDSGGDDDDSGAVDDDDATPVDVTADLEPCEGGVLAAFTEGEIEPPGAASDGYLVPGDDTLEALSASFEALSAGDAELAQAEVAVVGYEVCRGDGAEAGTALWRPLVAGSGRALFAWRAVGARPLIVGVPHPWFEVDVLAEGVEAFDRMDARGLVVAGTHRCANVAESPCDGTTDVCGEDAAPYRESDMAHVVDSVYQVAHELLSDQHEEAWVVSLHGMAADGVSLSDGTHEPADPGDPIVALYDALETALPGEYVTACSEFDGAVVDERLCGTTNAQGRYVNGSGDACSEAAAASSARFLHLEQSPDVRDDFDRVLDAMDSVLPTPE